MNTRLLGPQSKSQQKIISICVNASIATFFAGYSVVYAGLLRANDFKIAVIDGYRFNQWGWADSSLKSIIQGSVPVGAIAGALAATVILKMFSRRNGILFTNLLAFLSTFIMIVIPIPSIFIFMRFMQGMCLGIFASIVPLYINETQTPDLSSLGNLSQISMAGGQVFCCILSFISSAIVSKITSPQNSANILWLILAGFPLLTIIAQTILLHLSFSYETVKYYNETGQTQMARKLAQQLYNQSYVKQLMHKKYENNEVQLQNVNLQNSNIVNRIEQEKQLNAKKKEKTSRIAIIFAMHMGWLQQMSGVSAIVVYCKNTLEQALEGHETALDWSVLGIFILSIVGTLFTIKYMNRFGRKVFMQVGTIVCTLCLGLIAFCFYNKGSKSYLQSKGESNAIIMIMCVYMLFYGLSLGPIVWLYIPQIVDPSIVPYPTMANLTGSSLSIILFPLIANKKNAVYIPFLFFFCWCTAAIFVNQKYMVQTKDKSREEVFEEFRSMESNIKN